MGSLLGHPERHGDAMRAPWHPAGEDGWLGTRELPGYRAGALIVRFADLPGVDAEHLYLDVLRRSYSEKEAQRQLDTAVDWGRYAELYDFNAGRNELTLDEDRRSDAN